MAKKPGPLQQAQAITRAQYAPVDYQLGQASKRATAEQHALNAARTALIAQLQGNVGPATQAYDAAAQQTQDIARSAADLLAQANPNAQVQQSLAQVNAPQEQRQQLGQSLQSLFPGAGAVLNVEQGAIPGAGLVAQGAAQKQFLAGLPTVAALSGEQSLRSLLANQQKTRDDLVAQRLGIGGQLPGLVRDLQNRQEDVQYRDQQAARAIQQAALDRSFRAQQAQEDRAFRETQASLDYQRSLAITPYQKAQIAIEQKKLNADIAASKRSATKGGTSGLQLKVLPDGTTVLFNPNTGQTIGMGKHGKPGAIPGIPGITPNKVNELKGKAAVGAKQAYQGFTSQNKTPDYTATAPNPNDPKAGWSEPLTLPDGTQGYVNHHPPIGYQDAIRLARQAQIPVRLVLPALNVYYKRGERGRPQVGFFEATKATRTGSPAKRKRK